MRNYFVFQSSKDFIQLKRKSLSNLRDFLLTFLGNLIIHRWFREFYLANTRMQTWIRNQLTVRHSKVEILINFWDKLLGKIM